MQWFRCPPVRFAVPVIVLLAAASAASARPARQEQESSPAAAAWESSYELPPLSVQRIFEADKNYARLDNLSPDGRWFLSVRTSELSTLERMGHETTRLAMLELRGQRNRTARLDTYGITGLAFFDIDARTTREVALPPDSLVSDMTWSPGGGRIAFLLHGPERTEVWTASTSTGLAVRLSEAAVMATLGTRSQSALPRQSRMLQWTDHGSVITLLVPPDRGPEPVTGLAQGPIVRRTRDAETPNPTYPFLLQNRTDAARFRYHTSSQIAELRPEQPPRAIGSPGMYESLWLSPDGQYLLTERIVEPLSPLVAYFSFGRKLEVIDVQGDPVATIRERPLREGRSRGDNGPDRDLPREVTWLPGGSNLGYLQRQPEPEAEDTSPSSEGSDGERDDRILVLGAPFQPETARTVASSKERLSDLVFLASADHALANAAGDEDTRALMLFDLNSDLAAPVQLVEPYDTDDPLVLPGDPLVETSGNGIRHLRLAADGASLYLQGPGYQEDHRPRPFIDRVALDGGQRVRLFEGADGRFEQPLAALGQGIDSLVVQRESRTEFPDSWLWTPGEGFTEKLTGNQDPFPSITAVERIDFEFTRRDGLDIQARVSMPVGWQQGERVPAIFWTYPREYRDAKAYRRAAIRARNRNAFAHLNYLRWSDIWLTQGYAVVYPDVPILGDPSNDNYIQHLSDSLYAAIRKVDTMGLVDIDRIGHGGHSYGAFATANLLAHTPYFKAGIAGDGAYNRTLTPMGFQSERRFLWSGQDVYVEMSPFFQADHIDTPLLMYHGADDNNTGTFPIQSERMMQALTGLGKTAVLVVYPYESHGPRAIESYLDLWNRWLDWFDRYVKQAEPAQEDS